MTPNTTSQHEEEEEEQDGVLHALSEKYNKPGFQESILCLSEIALHGLAVNGLLVWIDIQRRTTTSKDWKEKAVKYFTDEEITNAKNLLWDISDDGIIGKIVNRQGLSQKQSEINDIEHALNALAEETKVPLFVASSNMVMQTPRQDTTQPGLKDIEEVMDSALHKQIDQLMKKCDESVSKTGDGNKKMEDIIKRLESLEGNVAPKVYFVQPPVGSTSTPSYVPTIERTPSIRIPNAPTSPADPIPTHNAFRFGFGFGSRSAFSQLPAEFDCNRLWNPGSVSAVNTSQPAMQSNNNIVNNNNNNNNNSNDNNRQPRGSWKQNLHLAAFEEIARDRSSSVIRFTIISVTCFFMVKRLLRDS